MQFNKDGSWSSDRFINPLNKNPANQGTHKAGVGDGARTFIMKSHMIVNETTSLYRVPAGKTFFLSTCCLSSDTGYFEFAGLLVTDENWIRKYSIIEHWSSEIKTSWGGLSFNPPILIPENWFVRLSTTGNRCFGFIYGWEE